MQGLDERLGVGGNILIYMATPPSLFGMISGRLKRAGFDAFPGWKRIIVEKPFGTDLPSAQALNREILTHWDEPQVYRVDHYLGKETVQNVLAFRFANELFEPLWNRKHVDHIQLTVTESVSVEGRGGYYDRSGVLRDMIQNHMLQMLAYVCMEPPASFAADDVRDEKSKLLRAVRLYSPEEVLENTVRGQYGPGKKADGKQCPAYRDEPDVEPELGHRDLRRPPAVHRQLAMGGRADLPPLGQGPLEARDRDRRPVQEGAGRALPRDARSRRCRRTG